MGTLEDGEVGISATNRNYKGRMGSKLAKSYLASPSVVAASAIAGYIDYQVEDRPGEVKTGIRINKAGQKEKTSVSIMEGFPARVEGRLLFCHQDNLNTDGIYPGKYTYQDDFTAEQQAAVAMENYDPKFQSMAKAGDVLAGGFNFGTGSSREQAATALMHKGIRLVVAGSFSETYKRNAFNNGFLLLEMPELVSELKERFGTSQLTVDAGEQIRIDFQSSEAEFMGKTYPFDPVGRAAQELVIVGGLENWVKSRIA
jgi:homoaconitate hydratase